MPQNTNFLTDVSVKSPYPINRRPVKSRLTPISSYSASKRVIIRSDGQHNQTSQPTQLNSLPRDVYLRLLHSRLRHNRHEQLHYDQPEYMEPNYDQSEYMEPNYDQSEYMEPNYDQSKYMEPNYDQSKYMEPNYDQSKYIEPNYDQQERLKSYYDQLEHVKYKRMSYNCNELQRTNLKYNEQIPYNNLIHDENAINERNIQTCSKFECQEITDRVQNVYKHITPDEIDNTERINWTSSYNGSVNNCSSCCNTTIGTEFRSGLSIGPI